ncbi:unnamed protein product [Rotaria magnacalcarata]|uniref:Uncharacterized protein n=2 Tax=Rotaria magnacalcarata TaxID=392030 RepID=A0A818YDR5_9BILA|nr:unnamed protein product [Rotaria magnacalcarata]CAF2074018.1 unnamed protein product [Rotaria magnacalcarata]CAF3755036.1 unnamed protein product [Rotaria magnacalcarata]CAF3810053.1 unnamed protein product [Rotaria magnacalcarata]
MQRQTKLVIFDNFDGTSYRYTTLEFNEETAVKDVVNFVLAKSNRFKPPMDIEIRNEVVGFVILDDDYLKEFNPFNPTAINSSKEYVELQVTLRSHVPISNADQEVRHSEDAVDVNVQDNARVQPVRESLPVPESLTPPSVRLSNDSKMGFLSRHNVNQHQRNQYSSDRKPVMIQGEKRPSFKNRILPLFRIWHDEIKNAVPGIIWNLLVYIIREVRKPGKRTLYYDPIRTFVNGHNVNENLDHYEIPIANEDWTSEEGAKLKLIVLTMKEAKVYSFTPVRVLCELEDNNNSRSSVDDNESCHLALVLKRNDHIQWETLVLSNQMVFPERPKKKIETNSSNNVTKTTPIASIRNQPRKRQDSSNKKPTKAKIPKLQDHSSIVDSSRNNNISHALGNQVLPVCYNTNPSMNILSRSVANISTDAQRLRNPSLFDSSATANNDQSHSLNGGYHTMNSLIQYDDPLGSSPTNYDTSDTFNDIYSDSIQPSLSPMNFDNLFDDLLADTDC